MSEAKKSRLLIPVVVLALGGAGFGGYMFAGGASAAPPPTTQPAEGEVVEVGVLTVTLPGPDAHYARVGLAVVLVEGVTEDAVAGRFPLVKDAAISILAGKTPDDFRTPAGLERLRRELSGIAQEIYPDGEVLRVVLTEAIVT
ncbi:MAG TPA: flagellar basal body-associated FliL family protein [Acidimicrobiia bacterium]|jgi:flagellar FliL protein